MATKVTKKQRKMRDGMNHATTIAYSKGYKKPTLSSLIFGQSGCGTYVNPRNFGL